MTLLPYDGIDYAGPTYRFANDGTMQTGVMIRSSIELDATASGYEKGKADALLEHIRRYIAALPDSMKPDFVDLERA